jgi:hypothetical protein
MSKSYTVLLNSQACNLQTVGNTYDAKGYTIDMAEVNDVSTGPNNIPLIFATFMPSSNNYQVHQGVTAHSSRVLGFLKPYNTTTTSYYSADVNTNPSIYLKSRPYLNDFLINIMDNLEPANVFLDNAPVPASMNTYILILRFELIKEH